MTGWRSTAGGDPTSDLIIALCTWSAVICEGIGLAVWIKGHSWWRACGWFAYTQGAFLITDMIGHERWFGVWNAMWLAYYIWVWWNGGGGGKTRKRLKKWAKSFTPVRRTAPQSA